jgi:transcriptional regulator with XRE-family HTH domain
MSLQTRLREFRLARDLTRTQLAILAGVDPSQVSRWETGDRRPTLTSITNLARVLGVSVDVLLRESDAPPPDPHQQAIESASSLLRTLGVRPDELQDPPDAEVGEEDPERCMVVIEGRRCALRQGHRKRHDFALAEVS